MEVYGAGGTQGPQPIYPRLAAFSVDAGQMKQVLFNLIQNAADSIGHDGTVTLRARADRKPLGNGETSVVVLEVHARPAARNTFRPGEGRRRAVPHLQVEEHFRHFQVRVRHRKPRRARLDECLLGLRTLPHQEGPKAREG